MAKVWHASTAGSIGCTVNTSLFYNLISKHYQIILHLNSSVPTSRTFFCKTSWHQETKQRLFCLAAICYGVLYLSWEMFLWVVSYLKFFVLSTIPLPNQFWLASHNYYSTCHNKSLIYENSKIFLFCAKAQFLVFGYVCYQTLVHSIISYSSSKYTIVYEWVHKSETAFITLNVSHVESTEGSCKQKYANFLVELARSCDTKMENFWLTEFCQEKTTHQQNEL